MSSKGPTALRARLHARRAEIEQAALDRIQAISDPGAAGDSEYAASLRAAVSSAVEYGLIAIERGEEHAPPTPPALLAQARIAARSGVSLDTVMRRYFAGYSLLTDFLIGEAEEGGLLQGAELKRLLRAQATVFDRLLAAVTEEYRRESESRLRSSEERRGERVQRLLDGELLDTSGLAYDFDVHHVGIVASGAAALDTLRDLSGRLDCRLLVVQRRQERVWAWLCARRAPDPAELLDLLAPALPERTAIALGEPGEGLPGWRLSHRQALAALPVALRGPERCVRYAEVAVLAAALGDDLLVTSLRRLYLAPLEAERDGGAAARETLRAYFASDRNVSSTAAALGLNRHTVTSRLRAVEERIGREVSSCAADLEAALRLADLGPPSIQRTEVLPRS